VTGVQAIPFEIDIQHSLVRSADPTTAASLLDRLDLP
jgi:hypothetical protein